MTTFHDISIPSAVGDILHSLTTQGFDAYIVGGCLRDTLLSQPVKDWDVTTSASPPEVISCFPHSRILDFGLKHNTIAVLTESGPVEITTYRAAHSQASPRPSSVPLPTQNPLSLTPGNDPLCQDLAHRDFTVNALAYHPRQGLIDPFGGAADLETRTLRCVRDPEARLREDPARIMRALRFSATKGFRIAPATQSAMLRLRDLLSTVAQERITYELMTFLTGRCLRSYLLDYRDIFAMFLPEIIPAFDFDQRNPYHCFDIWRHTAESVEAITAEAPWPLSTNDIPRLRLTMLLHDLGKPASWSLDGQGTGHFYGHPDISAAIAAQALRRLKTDNQTQLSVTQLVRRHDAPIPTDPQKLRHWLHRLTQEPFHIPAASSPQPSGDALIASACLLLHIKKADVLAQHPAYHSRLEDLAHLYHLITEVQAQIPCLTLRDLCLNGNDLLTAGYSPGPQIGQALNTLLTRVIDGTCPNTREALLAELRTL